MKIYTQLHTTHAARHSLPPPSESSGTAAVRSPLLPGTARDSRPPATAPAAFSALPAPPVISGSQYGRVTLLLLLIQSCHIEDASHESWVLSDIVCFAYCLNSNPLHASYNNSYPTGNPGMGPEDPMMPAACLPPTGTPLEHHPKPQAPHAHPRPSLCRSA